MKVLGWILIVAGIGALISFIGASASGMSSASNPMFAIGFLVIGIILVSRSKKKNSDKDKFEDIKKDDK